MKLTCASAGGVLQSYENFSENVLFDAERGSTSVEKGEKVTIIMPGWQCQEKLVLCF